MLNCFCDNVDPLLCSGRPPGHGCRCECHIGWEQIAKNSSGSVDQLGV